MTELCPVCHGGKLITYTTLKPCRSLVVRYRKCALPKCAGRLVVETRDGGSRRVRLPRPISKFSPRDGGLLDAIPAHVA